MGDSTIRVILANSNFHRGPINPIIIISFFTDFIKPAEATFAQIQNCSASSIEASPTAVAPSWEIQMPVTWANSPVKVAHRPILKDHHRHLASRASYYPQWIQMRHFSAYTATPSAVAATAFFTLRWKKKGRFSKLSPVAPTVVLIYRWTRRSPVGLGSAGWF